MSTMWSRKSNGGPNSRSNHLKLKSCDVKFWRNFRLSVLNFVRTGTELWSGQEANRKNMSINWASQSSPWQPQTGSECYRRGRKVHFAEDVQYPARENMHKVFSSLNITQMIIDSIANVIGQALWLQLKRRHINCVSKRSTKKLLVGQQSNQSWETPDSHNW